MIFNYNKRKLSFSRLFFLLFTFVVALIQLHAQPSITLDASATPKKVDSKIGFLHLADLRDIQEYVGVLKPKYWRESEGIYSVNSLEARAATYKILQDNKIEIIFVINDIINRSLSPKIKDWNKNLHYLNEYKKVVLGIYRKYEDNVVYDIWNEPNLKGSWGGSQQDFFQVFKYIYDLLRAQPKGDLLKITGPSTAGLDKKFIVDFLNFCQSNKMKLDVINWHENGDLKDCMGLSKRINYVKNDLLPQFKSLGIQSIYIPEIIGNKDNYNPLTALFYIQTIDQSVATAACKACWGAECGNNRLDGLLDPQKNTRSVWWTYRYYAESLAARMPATSNSDSLITIGYTDLQKDTISILFGNVASQNINAKIVLKQISYLKNFGTSKNFHYILYQVPNTEAKPLLQPIILMQKSAKVSNGTGNIALNNLDNKSVYLLKIFK